MLMCRSFMQTFSGEVVSVLGELAELQAASFSNCSNVKQSHPFKLIMKLHAYFMYIIITSMTCCVC